MDCLCQVTIGPICFQQYKKKCQLYWYNGKAETTIAKGLKNYWKVFAFQCHSSTRLFSSLPHLSVWPVSESVWFAECDHQLVRYSQSEFLNFNFSHSLFNFPRTPLECCQSFPRRPWGFRSSLNDCFDCKYPAANRMFQIRLKAKLRPRREGLTAQTNYNLFQSWVNKLER